MDFRSRNLASPLSADATIVLAVGASPFAYTNTTNRAQLVYVVGGNVTGVTYTRPGSAAIATGLTDSLFLVLPGDTLTVTYAVAPTMTAVPWAG